MTSALCVKEKSTHWREIACAMCSLLLRTLRCRCLQNSLEGLAVFLTFLWILVVRLLRRSMFATGCMKLLAVTMLTTASVLILTSTANDQGWALDRPELMGLPVDLIGMSCHNHFLPFHSLRLATV